MGKREEGERRGMLADRPERGVGREATEEGEGDNSTVEEEEMKEMKGRMGRRIA